MSDLVQQQAARLSRPAAGPVAAGVLRRQCATCGCHAPAGVACAACGEPASRLQRRASGRHSDSDAVPASVRAVLSGPGQALDGATRTFMEARFGHDFSRVRVHADAQAGESARAVHALAYTVGQNVVFARERYAPATPEGKKLLAHELTHVVQQGGGAARAVPAVPASLVLDRPDSALEREAHGMESAILAGNPSAGVTRAAVAAPMLSRASPDAVGYTMRLGGSAHTGIQFSPANVTDTRVGPVTVQGGLLSTGASRLNVILGANLSLHALARQLLPLWVTATPFTPPGAAAPLPLDIITEEELARGLLVYNQTYLPVPAMTNWRAGLLFPLPVEIDALTGVATLHPLQIRALAGGFDPAWLPQLDLRAGAGAAPAAATLALDVSAFLARETSALARGIHLGARALTNATAELPFLREALRQLGAGAFDVALAFMDNLVNREISLLAAQRDGAAILGAIRSALAAAPAAPSATQQASLTRANLMLGLVAAVVAQAPPAAAHARADKTITVDTVKLAGSSHDPASDIASANAILSQCNVRVAHGVNASATPAQTAGWLGDTDLHSNNNCAGPSAEERTLFRDAGAAFGFGARFSAFFPATVSGINGSGYSCLTPTAAPLFRNKIVVANSGDAATLAHELGHILINLGPHTATGLMSPRPALPAMRLPQVSDAHCTRLYNNA